MTGLVQIQALYGYGRWADRHVLDAASQASEAEVARPLGASYGSVRDNLWHIVSAQDTWLGRFTGSAPVEPERPDSGEALPSLRAAFEDTHARAAKFVASLDEDGLARVLTYTDTRGREQQRVLWQAMLHVANHGTHHRAETALLLTSLGYPPRQLDYIFYELELAGGPPRLT